MTKLSLIAFAAGLCCLCASPAAAADAEVSDTAISAAEPASPPGESSGWQFSAGPYLWLAGLKGDMGVVEEVEPVKVDLSFGDILGALKFAAMGTFEARNGRFVGTADLMYLSMGASDNIEIREVDFLDVELDAKTFITTLTAGYRAVDQDGLSLDVFAGGRINSMKTSLDLEGPQRSFDGSKTETWLDPLAGIRFKSRLGQRWSLETYADIGGFGVGSHFTWQVLGLVQYDLSSRWSLSAGWRHLKIDYEDDGFVFDAAMDGPILGAVYRF
jgi:opacity protein-like surface antigen